MREPIRHWTQKNMPDLHGSYAVVTGGTSGVGFAMSAALLRHGATVIIVGKQASKGVTAAAKLRAQTGQQNVTFMGADLADQAATKHLANRLLRMLPKLDILINNAGVMMPAKRTLTRDGLELMWAVNYFAGFILTIELMPLLLRSDHARVVNVASIAMGRPRLTFNQFDGCLLYTSPSPRDS